MNTKATSIDRSRPPRRLARASHDTRVAGKARRASTAFIAGERNAGLGSRFPTSDCRRTETRRANRRTASRSFDRGVCGSGDNNKIRHSTRLPAISVGFLWDWLWHKQAKCVARAGTRRAGYLWPRAPRWRHGAVVCRRGWAHGRLKISESN